MSIKVNHIREILGKHILTDGYGPIIDLNKSHGSWLIDQRDGSEYLDMFSMYASGAVGYNHPYILENSDRLTLVSHNKTTLSDVYNSYFAEFLDTFSKTAIPDYLPYAFFIDGGANSGEGAVIVGHNASLGQHRAFQISGNSPDTSVMEMFKYTNDTSGPTISMS